MTTSPRGMRSRTPHHASATCKWPRPRLLRLALGWVPLALASSIAVVRLPGVRILCGVPTRRKLLLLRNWHTRALLDGRRPQRRYRQRPQRRRRQSETRAAYEAHRKFAAARMKSRNLMQLDATGTHARPATLRGGSTGTEGRGRWLVFKAVEKFGRRAKAPCSRVTFTSALHGARAAPSSQ